MTAMGKEDVENVSAHVRERRIARAVARKSIHFGGDHERTPRTSFPGNIHSARNFLIRTLEAAMDGETASDVVDALDAYLEEGSGRASLTLEDLTPNYKSELESVRAERDAAITCAEQALEQMQTTLDALRGTYADADAPKPDEDVR
jgi:hypothetical protein